MTEIILLGMVALVVVLETNLLLYFKKKAVKYGRENL